MLPRALDSVFKQTYEDFEVIVVHDGPMDEATMDVLRLYEDKFATRDIDFTVIATEEESGYQCVPKNVATWLARGDYIGYLDDDNEWSVDFMEVSTAAIEDGRVWPDVVYGRRRCVLDKGVDAQVGEHTLYVGETSYVPWNEEARTRLAANAVWNFIDGGDMLIAKGALWRMHVATGMMWNEAKRRFGDWELVTRGVFFADWRLKGVDYIAQVYHWTGDNLQITRPLRETPSAVGV